MPSSLLVIGGLKVEFFQPLPQQHYNDLYTAVYRLIDDAKTAYELIKLYKGSHGSLNPHEIVTSFGSWFYLNRRGLIAYGCERANDAASGHYTAQHLAEFDATCQPHVPLSDVFALMAKFGRHRDETEEHYLNWLVQRGHNLGAYRGGTSGYDDEARAFACAFYRQLGVECVPDDVLIFDGGAKAVFLATCAALMVTRDGDDLRHDGGLILAPAGYYQSLRLIPAVFGATIHVEDELTGPVVREWLTDTAHLSGRIIYCPLVNNMDGALLTHARAYDIAGEIRAHNRTNASNPVHVIGDDVYAGSWLTDNAAPCPIGAVPDIGRWCVSVVTPSKTAALPTARVAFAVATNPTLRAALGHYRTLFSHGRVPQVGELTGVAALCLTPPSWVARWNEHYRVAVRYLATEVGRLNTELGAELFAVDAPDAGWYVPLRVRRGLFGEQVHSGVGAQAALLYYGEQHRQTGLAMLPGELFGACRTGDWYTLRTTVAVDTGTLTQAVARLRDLARTMQSSRRDGVIDYALARARRVVPGIDATVTNTRY
ncbi:MAG TPA: pyridoxal phosphate-dependent aminotransferase [Pseudonocardiaceae bacterium]|nr:pyridoxal phosphate-dependent aminotransferase [Pseudonocardiaceae bacterium]